MLDPSAMQCPSRATVMVTRKEKRWELWEDKYCTTGCKLDGDCGEEGEAEVPCCVKLHPYNANLKVRSHPPSPNAHRPQWRSDRMHGTDGV